MEQPFYVKELRITDNAGNVSLRFYLHPVRL